jgi:selenocysteine lyase/cysteine desulfurase
LAQRLIEELLAVPAITLYGITDPTRFDRRAPVAASRLEGSTPRQVAERLGGEGIFVGD